MTIGRIPSVEGGIQPTIFDAKADLLTATANDTPARLAVGSNDQVLVADSSTSTGLAWKSYGAQFVAGKNKIINGDFGVWQRGTSFTVASDTYTADRWLVAANGGQTMAFTRETFTPGTAPVSGYEGKYFYQYAVTAAGSGNTYNQLKTRIEDARTFAGQTVVLSFWAKGSASYNISSVGYQNFGTGGSPSSAVLAWSSGNLAVTTSWQRFSYSFTMPSVSGKTFGTNGNDYVEFYINMPTNQTSTTGIWGVQLEAGSVATPFTTATGTIQGELAACQRYYFRTVATGSYGTVVPISMLYDGTQAIGILTLPVTMRAAPTSVDFSSIKFFRYDDASYNISAVSLSTPTTSPQYVQMVGTISGGTAGWVGRWVSQGSTSSYLGVSAEL